MKLKENPERIEAMLAEAKSAMKHTTDKRMYERYQCMVLYLSGHSRADIATILQRRYETVGAYIRSYASGGLEALTLDHSPGRPCKLTPEQEDEL